MTTNQQLAILNDDNIDVFKLGEVLVKSGYFSDAGDVAKAVVKVLAGRELGLGPVTAMRELNIIKGKVTLSAAIIAARIKASGRYNFKVRELDNERCLIEFTEGGQPAGVSSFTMKDAQAAGLTSENYRKFPRNMLFSRALTNGARWYCSDVFSGAVYTPDELNGGLVIDSQPAPEAEAKVETIPDAKPIPALSTVTAPVMAPSAHAAPMVASADGYTPPDFGQAKLAPAPASNEPETRMCPIHDAPMTKRESKKQPGRWYFGHIEDGKMCFGRPDTATSAGR